MAPSLLSFAIFFCVFPSFFLLAFSASDYCQAIQTNLTNCAGYLSSTSAATPSAACCASVRPALQANVVNQTAQCLCEFTSSNDVSDSVRTHALGLPSACNISSPISNLSSSCETGSGSTSGNGTMNGTGAGVLSAIGPSFVAVSFTSLLSYVLTGAFV